MDVQNRHTASRAISIGHKTREILSANLPKSGLRLACITKAFRHPGTHHTTVLQVWILELTLATLLLLLPSKNFLHHGHLHLVIFDGIADLAFQFA